MAEGTPTKQVPYQPDVRAKGWRFELDHERLLQSDTWALAAPEVRPWLLMLWMVAWQQTPCGSLPADDQLIAARIGMPLELFQQHRAVLMRKWWVADDGRLYHNVLVLRVAEMQAKRDKDAKRTANWRATRQKSDVSNDGVTRDTHVSSEDEARDYAVSSTPSTKHQAPEPTLGDKSPKPPARERAVLPDWLPIEAWAGFVEMRKRNKAPLTDQAIKLAIGELEKLRAQGQDPASMLNQSTMNAWKGIFPLKEANGARVRPSSVLHGPFRGGDYRGNLGENPDGTVNF